MRITRSKRREEDASDAARDPESPAGGPNHTQGSLASVSNEAVGRLLKRAASRKAPGAKGQPSQEEPKDTEGEMMRAGDKRKAREELPRDFSLKRCTTRVVEDSTSSKVQAGEGSGHCVADDFEWEEGSVSVLEPREPYSHDLGQEVTVEFTDLPSSAQKKTPRRISIKDKELAELVHKVHLLCLLGRGRLVDEACNDPLIQASLFSLLPAYLLKIQEVPRLTAKMLGSLVRWFHENFRIRDQSVDKGSFKSNLSFALETREGTTEEIAALSVALFRALNLTSRFVSILDVTSLKPDPDMSGGGSRLDTRLFLSGGNVYSPRQINSQYPVCSASGSADEDMPHEISHRGTCRKKDNNSACKKNLLNVLTPSGQLDTGSSNASSSNACRDDLESSSTKCDEESKRKGDVEFQLQMEMALSVTAMTSHDSKVESNCGSPFLTHPSKQIRSKVEESLVSAYGSPSAVWSRKAGPPLYWAEVYCSGETLTGRWVHVDAASEIIDGEDKVETAVAAWRKRLRYVVAFAGLGAKDVTRRYCKQWYKIASQRVSSEWWDTVMTPLKELESGASGSMVHLDAFQKNTSSYLDKKVPEVTCSLGIDSSIPTETSLKESLDPTASGPSIEASKQLKRKMHQEPRVHYPEISYRNSLEDLELETRALTEPLPTNQLAYKNHHLYAIERWLTKNQILHPKGPVLGYCSGHPVYPRSCVQTLQTKHKWLRDGLQVRANEVPTKVVERSKKFVKFASEPGASEGNDGEATKELYGKWQLEVLQLPHAVNGIVPKNERGQVEVWSERCLPPGTVHLRLPRLAPVARRLDIDYAPAMVGFEFRNGRSFPIFEGIVICTEFKDAILEAFAEEEERRETEERKRNELQALSRWFQLLSSIITRQRLQNSYVESPSISISHNAPNNQMNDRIADQKTKCEGDMLRGPQRGSVQERSVFLLSREHEHVFPIEDQSFDEDSSIRIKRCHCGFSIEVEEL